MTQKNTSIKLISDYLRQYILTTIIALLTCSPTQSQNLQSEIKFSDHKFLAGYGLKKITNTDIFQGNCKRRAYFEGWYFKMVSENGNNILSVIPGISLSADGKEKHAFIQLINGVTAETSYYSFPIESFSFSKKEFEIKIGENYFSKDSIILNLNDSNGSISGKIELNNHVEYNSGKSLTPGIMGWYRFVAFMQCYHGVVSISNQLKGSLTLHDKKIDFRNGKGYIEKDWGSGMPSAWIWIQSNHFNEQNTSLMLSIADVPWLGKSFNGFLGFFYHNKHLYRFATYLNTKLQLEISDSNSLKIKIKNAENTFIINAKSNNTGLLKAPVKGSMDRRIPESIDATLKITMLDKKGNTIFIDSTNITGLEMVGDFRKLEVLKK